MLSDQERNKLKELVDDAFWASTKADAKKYISSLESQAGLLRANLTPYAYGKLQEVLAACITGSGQVRDKEHWINRAKTSWYTFERDSKETPGIQENC